MSQKYDPIASIHTRHSIWRMYRDAADDDYLVARFSARSNLLYQFWWNAQQAIEKYLKAALLLNGKPVRKYGHNLAAMYETVLDFSGDLIPRLLCPPNAIQQRVWPSSKSRGFFLTDKFIELVDSNGDPNNRYRAFSTYTRPEYLIYFDEICFNLRRITFPLDLYLDDTEKTARSELQIDRRLQLHKKMSFEGAMSAKHFAIWGEHFKWCNFSYFYDETVEAGIYPSWGGAINSECYLALSSKDCNYRPSLLWIAEQGFPSQLRKQVLAHIDQTV